MSGSRIRRRAEALAALLANLPRRARLQSYRSTWPSGSFVGSICFLIFPPLCGRGFARADDTGATAGKHLRVDYEQNAPQCGISNCYPPCGIGKVGSFDCVGVRQCSERFFEGYAVLLQVDRCFSIVPFEITKDDRRHVSTILTRVRRSRQPDITGHHTKYSRPMKPIEGRRRRGLGAAGRGT